MTFATRNHGFTLVELMIGIALSALILSALVTLLVNMSRAQAELDASSRQIENGRYAIELLTEELKLAGYFANVARGGATAANPDPCAAALANLGWSTAPLGVPAALEGRRGDGDEPPCIANHRDLTAVLALRRLSTTADATAAIVAGNPYLQTSSCAADPFGSPFVFSDAAGDFTLRTKECVAASNVRRYLSRIYFVSSCSDCARDQIPTLKRLELRDGAMVETPLAEGIEEVQYEYGFDVDGDGSPDQFANGLDGVAGSPANDWSNVMAVRIWLVSRTSEALRNHTDRKTYALGAFGVRGPYNDGFKRRVYTSLANLNNVAGLRE